MGRHLGVALDIKGNATDKSIIRLASLLIVPFKMFIGVKGKDLGKIIRIFRELYISKL